VSVFGTVLRARAFARVDTLSAGEEGGSTVIDQDRERLESDEVGLSVARSDIVASWRRSQSCGVDPDRVPIVEGEVCLDTRMARVAIPVLEDMADLLRGGRTSLLLSAPDGTMLWRWSDDSQLNALLDRRSAQVGTRWNEDIIGTNGLGTALETVRPILIRGSEHYCEALHEFTCAGAPIRHPITRRVAGVLSVTSLVRNTSPLMTPTLIKLAREVEAELYSGSTLRERELLHHFLVEQGGRRKAVVAVNADVVIANKAAAEMNLDDRRLWDQLADVARAGVVDALELPDGAGAARVRPIEHAGSVVGLVIVVDQHGPAPTPRDHAPGPRVSAGTATPRWAQLPALLRAAADGSDRVLVTGPPGVGKRRLIREAYATAECPVLELDGAGVAELGSRAWLAKVRATLVGGAPGVILLSHLDLLDPAVARGLAHVLDDLPRRDDEVGLAATATASADALPDPALRALLDRFGADPFEVPPLRLRPDDVVDRLVDQGLGFPVLSRDAVTRARCHPWPGNHRQLEEFRRWLRRQKRAIVDLPDLPPVWVRDASGIRLTPIQEAEADTIAKVLRATGGNKVAAAMELGISRSSLYRKLDLYRLV
jgi:transcriptional regulator of acetoin/glycerol metabolism